MMQECEFGFGFGFDFESKSDSKNEVPSPAGRRRNFNDQGILYKERSVSQENTAERAALLLQQLPANCGYEIWFKAACALKHSGCKYEVFRDWSATAPEKFNETDCRRTWNSIACPASW